MLVSMLQHVSSRVAGFFGASQCLWGKLQNLSLLKVSKQVVLSFCVAGVALCDIPTCFIPCRTSFCGASTILLRRFQKVICSFRSRRNTLETSNVILRGRRSTLDVSCCVFLANRNVSELRQVVTLYAPQSTLHTLHLILYTLHSTLYTLHFALHTSHYTLCTLHSTL